MSSRRARIKAVANLPVRRKNDTGKSSQKSQENESATSTQTSASPSVESENAPKIIADTNIDAIDVNPKLLGTPRAAKGIISKNDANQSSVTNEDKPLTNNIDYVESNEQAVQTAELVATNGNINSNSATSQNIPRRRITKPVLINKKSSQVSTLNKTQIINSPASESDVVTCLEKDGSELNKNSVVTELHSSHNNLQITPLNVQNNNSLPEKEKHNIVVGIPVDDALIFNPPQPVSKNRPRIRPTPRLTPRRNSVQGSTSESEDEGRHNHKTSSKSPFSHTITKSGSTRIARKRRIRRTEAAKKLAEARRVFSNKFGTRTPDRSQLTVFDMIYYNPSANPMRKADEGETENTEKIKDIEETIDDPEPELDPGPETNAGPSPTPEQEEDQTALPVPQIKIGPKGEIILDEQSLVIETTGTKKGREEIANSNLVYDDGNTNYGIYKKRRRPKDWTVSETLRFYKTLNTVGTDFSIMLSLFPGRSRRELKMKFKKEEKINADLVNKALRNPQDFDITSLAEELKREELIAKKKAEPKKPPEPKPKGPAVKKKRRKKRLSKLAKLMYTNSDGELEIGDEEENEKDAENEVKMQEMLALVLEAKQKRKNNISYCIMKDQPFKIQTNYEKFGIRAFDPLFMKQVEATLNNNKNVSIESLLSQSVIVPSSPEADKPPPKQKRNREPDDNDKSKSKLKRKKEDKEKDNDILGLLADVAETQERLDPNRTDASEGANNNEANLNSDIQLSEVDDYIKNRKSFINPKERTTSNGSEEGLLSDLGVFEGLNLSCGDTLLNFSELVEGVDKEVLSLDNTITTPNSTNSSLESTQVHAEEISTLPVISQVYTITSEDYYFSSADMDTKSNEENLEANNYIATIASKNCGDDSNLELEHESQITKNSTEMVDNSVGSVVSLPFSETNMNFSDGNDIMPLNSSDDIMILPFSSDLECEQSLGTKEPHANNNLPSQSIYKNDTKELEISITHSDKYICNNMSNEDINEYAREERKETCTGTSEKSSDQIVCDLAAELKTSEMSILQGKIPSIHSANSKRKGVSRSTTNVSSEIIEISFNCDIGLSHSTKTEEESQIQNEKDDMNDSGSGESDEESNESMVVEVSMTFGHKDDMVSRIDQSMNKEDALKENCITSNTFCDHPAASDDSVLLGSVLVETKPSTVNPGTTEFSVLQKVMEDGKIIMKKIDLPSDQLQLIINNMLPVNAK